MDDLRRNPGELAGKLGINPAGLAATVAQVQRRRRRRRRHRIPPRRPRPRTASSGDSGNTPNPCLAPLVTAPFHAVPITAGVLGTSGGLDTDFDGRVLDRHRQPIPGLYAAGNVSAGVFRNNYPGGGATLGSAITRAFAVGEHLAHEFASAPARGSRTPTFS